MFKRRYKKATQTDETERKPRVIDPEKARQKTFDRAVNLLTHRARSIEELRTRLIERDWTTPEIVDYVIERLKEYNYLNDEQFAKNFVASAIRQKAVGKRVLQQKLSLKKLDRAVVESALEQVLEETPEDELIDRAIKKRLRLKGKPETREDTKKFYDFLLRQGFSYDLIGEKMRAVATMEENFDG